MGRRHLRAPLSLPTAAEPVERVELRGREHQPAVLVLSVEGQQPAAELTQISDRRHPTAYIGTGAPVGPDPTGEHQFLSASGNPLVTTGGQPRWQLEHALHVRLSRAFSNDAGAGLASQQEVERVGEQRLPSTGFTGENVQPRRKP